MERKGTKKAQNSRFGLLFLTSQSDHLNRLTSHSDIKPQPLQEPLRP